MHSETLNPSEQWPANAIPARPQSEAMKTAEAGKLGELQSSMLQFAIQSCMYVRLSQAELQQFWSNV